jgi:hypothetical protein
MRATVLIFLGIAATSWGQYGSAAPDQRWHRYSPGQYRFTLQFYKTADIVAIVEPVMRIEEEERTREGQQDRKEICTVEQFRVVSGVGVKAGERIDAVIPRSSDGKGGKVKLGTTFEAGRFLLIAKRPVKGMLTDPCILSYMPKDYHHTIVAIRATEVWGMDLLPTKAKTLSNGSDPVSTALLATATAFNTTEKNYLAFETLRRFECVPDEKISGRPAREWLIDVLAPKLQDRSKSLYTLALYVHFRVPGSVEALVERSLVLEQPDYPDAVVLTDFPDGSWASMNTSWLVDAAVKAKSIELRMFCLRSIKGALAPGDHAKVAELLDRPQPEGAEGVVRMMLLDWFAHHYERKDKKPVWISDSSPWKIKDEAELVAFWKTYKGQSEAFSVKH